MPRYAVIFRAACCATSLEVKPAIVAIKRRPFWFILLSLTIKESDAAFSSVLLISFTVWRHFSFVDVSKSNFCDYKVMFLAEKGNVLHG